MANSGNPLDIMKQLNPDNKQDDDVKSEAQKEHDKRKEEQERQRFGEYYSRRINWPIWKRIDDDKLTEEDQLNDKLCGIRSPGKLEKLDPGVYEHQKDPKDAFNILFNADRSAHPVPLSGKHADPNSPEYRIAYSKTIDFVAANEGIPIEIDLPKEKGSDDFAYGVESKYQYQKDQLKTLLSLAAEKGLPVSFSNDTKEFLKRISADEARDFYAMKRQLKINHQYNQMSLGLNDEKGLQKNVKALDNQDKLAKLIENQPNLPDPDAAIEAEFKKKMYVEKDKDGKPKLENGVEKQVSTPEDKLNAISKEITLVDSRLERVQLFREEIAAGLEAQDKLLNDPEALRKAKNFEGLESLKSTSEVIKDVLKKHVFDSDQMHQEYEGRLQVIDDIKNDNRATEAVRGQLLDSIDKEISDLEKRRVILNRELNSSTFADTQLNADPKKDDLKKLKSDCLDNLQKLKERIDTETTKVNEVSDSHKERSGPNADVFYQDIKNQLETEYKDSQQAKPK